MMRSITRYDGQRHTKEKRSKMEVKNEVKMEVNSLTLADDSLGPQGIVLHEVLNSQTAKQA
jgi:hypothetical protein